MTILASFALSWNDKTSEHQTGNQELQVVFLTTSLYLKRDILGAVTFNLRKNFLVSH